MDLLKEIKCEKCGNTIDMRSAHNDDGELVAVCEKCGARIVVNRVIGQHDVTCDFEIKDGELVKYNGAGGDVVIPDGVTAIGEGAFYECRQLISVTIPDSVKKAGAFSFYHCTSLVSVKNGNGITSIGSMAFFGCRSLQDITIASGLNEIGSSAFYNCDNLTEDCKKKIAEVEERQEAEEAAKIVEFEIKDGKLVKYNGAGGDVVIPDGVTIIGTASFSHCVGLTSVTIPDGVRKIFRYAFRDCRNLTRVTIGDSLISIGDEAFIDCVKLESITIPSGIKRIGQDVFCNCDSLTEECRDKIGGIEWRQKAEIERQKSRWLTQAIISELEIKDGILIKFKGYTDSLDIPKGVRGIGDRVFWKNSLLKSVTIPEGVISIGNGSFDDCVNLESVTIPDSVISIDDSAFGDCSSLTSIIIPNSVKNIGHSAFMGCVGLKSITIPEAFEERMTEIFPKRILESGDKCKIIYT